jgi:hypothetical protein
LTARVLTLACLCLFASTARAQEAAVDPDAVVREILELSGKRKHFEQLVLESQAQIDAKRSQLNSKDVQRFRASTRKVYQVAPLYQVVLEHHRSAYDAKRCEALLEWLRTPLSRQLSEQEVRSSSLKEQKAIQKYAEQLKTKPLPAVREALLERVQEANREMEFNRRILRVFVRSTVSGANSLLPADKRLSSGQVDEAVSQTQEQLGPPLRQAVRSKVQYSYRGTSDEDLRAYLKFLESDPGRWYVQLSMDAIVKALEQAGTKLAEELAQAPTEQKEPQGKKRKKRKK